MITKRVEKVLQQNYGRKELDKGRVMIEVVKRFDAWETTNDLPPGVEEHAAKLFRTLNAMFGLEQKAAKRRSAPKRSTAAEGSA
ncbi:MAG TPA: hypothetical protein VF329_05070 [Gammaproteobacteria bacterium]